MQGIPGAGKTHHAARIAASRAGERGSRVVFASADAYPGLYEHDEHGVRVRFDLLGLAHGKCFRDAVEAVQRGDDVIVDNTNTTTEEVAPYVLLGQAYGVKVRIVRVDCHPDVAYHRQTHEVPRRAHSAMAMRLEEFSAPKHWPAVEHVDGEFVSGGRRA